MRYLMAAPCMDRTQVVNLDVKRGIPTETKTAIEKRGFTQPHPRKDLHSIGMMLNTDEICRGKDGWPEACCCHLCLSTDRDYFCG